MKGIINSGANTSLPLRSYPDPYSEALCTIPNGTEVTLIGAQGEWLQAMFNGVAGWLAGQYVKTYVSGLGATDIRYVNTSSGGLNMRKAASTSAAVITSLPKGTAVTVTGSAQNGFVPVTANGKSGWVSSQYLTAPTAATAVTPTSQTAKANVAATTVAAAKEAQQSQGVLSKIVDTAKTAVKAVVETSPLAQVTSAIKEKLTDTANAVVNSVSNNNQAAAAFVGQTKYVSTNSGSLNLRSGASTSDTKIGSLSRGEAVTTTGAEQNGFTPVKTSSGATGWVSSQYLSDSAPSALPEVTPTKKDTVQTDTVVPSGIIDVNENKGNGMLNLGDKTKKILKWGAIGLLGVGAIYALAKQAKGAHSDLRQLTSSKPSGLSGVGRKRRKKSKKRSTSKKKTSKSKVSLRGFKLK